MLQKDVIVLISWYVSVYVCCEYLFLWVAVYKKPSKETVTSQSQHYPILFLYSLISLHLLPLFSLNILLKRIECFVISWNSLIHFKFDLSLIFIWSPSVVFELVHCRIHLQRCSWRSWSRKQGRRYTQTPLFYRTVHLLLQLGFPRFSVRRKRKTNIEIEIYRYRS